MIRIHNDVSPIGYALDSNSVVSCSRKKRHEESLVVETILTEINKKYITASMCICSGMYVLLIVQVTD